MANSFKPRSMKQACTHAMPACAQGTRGRGIIHCTVVHRGRCNSPTQTPPWRSSAFGGLRVTKGVEHKGSTATSQRTTHRADPAHRTPLDCRPNAGRRQAAQHFSLGRNPQVAGVAGGPTAPSPVARAGSLSAAGAARSNPPLPPHPLSLPALLLACHPHSPSKRTACSFLILLVQHAYAD
jgi:hypothetical protein